MRFPDPVTVHSPTGVDEYGNPGGFATSTDTATAGFLVLPDTLLLPGDVEVEKGDRVTVGSTVYTVSDALPARSPARRVLWRLKVAEVPT